MKELLGFLRAAIALTFGLASWVIFALAVYFVYEPWKSGDGIPWLHSLGLIGFSTLVGAVPWMFFALERHLRY